VNLLKLACNKIYLKMALLRLAVFLLVSSVFVACGSAGGDESSTESTQKNEQAALYKEVIDIHDEVMPRMRDINQLLKDIDTRVSEFEADSLLTPDQLAEKQNLESTKSLLEDANEGMMSWMRDFQQIEEDQEHEEVIKYLSDEKQKIQAIKEDILSAIEEAESSL
jgi:methylphosphotriester-DNA--protein-cysteine methyltransferase